MTENRLPEWARKLAVFDLETTGVNIREARIVTACVAELDSHGTVVDERVWLANPGVVIPEQATAVHGVTTQMAMANGQDPATVVAEIVAMITQFFRDGVPVVAYNAPFDFSILAAEARRHGIAPIGDPAPIVDPLVIDKAVDRFRKGKRTLSVTSDHYGVELTDAHNATADAVAAGRIAQSLARAFPDELDVSALDLHLKQVGWAREQAESFTAWMRGQGRTDFTSSGAWPLR